MTIEQLSPMMTTDELVQRLDDDPTLFLLDVREPDEFAGALGHIPGARLVPLGRLAEGVEALARDRPVVTVCRSGTRSAQASVLLRKAGYDQVGGFVDASTAGGGTVARTWATQSSSGSSPAISRFSAWVTGASMAAASSAALAPSEVPRYMKQLFHANTEPICGANEPTSRAWNAGRHG